MHFCNFAVDRCPMYFNDGTDPWNIEENHIRVFDFNDKYRNSARKESGLCLTANIMIFLTATYLMKKENW